MFAAKGIPEMPLPARSDDRPGRHGGSSQTRWGHLSAAPRMRVSTAAGACLVAAVLAFPGVARATGPDPVPAPQRAPNVPVTPAPVVTPDPVGQDLAVPRVDVPSAGTTSRRSAPATTVSHFPRGKRSQESSGPALLRGGARQPARPTAQPRRSAEVGRVNTPAVVRALSISVSAHARTIGRMFGNSGTAANARTGVLMLLGAIGLFVLAGLSLTSLRAVTRAVRTP